MNLLGFVHHVHGTAGLRIARRVILVFLAMEAACYAAFRSIDHEFFTPSRLQTERRVIARRDIGSTAPGAERSRARLGEEILQRFEGQTLHPFVGFVFDPEHVDAAAMELLGGAKLSRFGFLVDDVVFEPPRKDRVVVGIAGGSVGMLLAIQGKEVLARELRRSPALADKEIVITPLALPGFKQPQQLLALNYFLVLGAHFDWIVNLDGFNELGLSLVENVPKNVAPYFPRAWYWQANEVPDPDVRRLMGKVSHRKGERRDLARAFSVSPFDMSVTWNLLWRYLDAGLARQVGSAEHELLDWEPTERDFAAQGPWYAEGTAEREDAYRTIVDVWMESSRQMHGLCTANGIRYFHFLQPNQYVPDSKPMGPAERARAWSEHSPFVEPIARGYPMLIDAGDELLAEGISFHDLSGAFAGVEDWLYADPCCHYNEAGNRLLAVAIAQRILADMNDR